MPENTYLVIRHGKTEWNAQGRFLGSTDVPLSSAGRMGVEQITLPRDFSIDKIYSSPLLRSVQTARMLAQRLGMSEEEIVFLADLQEKSLGLIEGMKHSEVSSRFPEVWNGWRKGPEVALALRYPGAESEGEVINRVQKVVQQLEELHTKETLLLVTHSGVLRALRYLLGEKMPDLFSTATDHNEILKFTYSEFVTR